MHAKGIAYCFAPLIAGCLSGPQTLHAPAAQMNAYPGTARAAVAQASQFPPVAIYMSRRYFNRDTTCPSYSGATTAYNSVAAKLPLTECLGVIMRFTSLTIEPNGGWIPKPEAVCDDPRAYSSCGGVSAIFLWVNAKFSIYPGFNGSHGFTLYPNQGKYAMPAGKTAVAVLCAYPGDAGTDLRTTLGCGPASKVDNTTYALKNNPNWCSPQTADTWRLTYFKGGTMGQCAFDLSGQSGNDPAQAFRENLKGVDLIRSGISNGEGWQYNELRLATWGTDPQSSTALPIESFFYLSGTTNGLRGAQDDQQKYYTLTGQFVPIVQITQPSFLADDFQFHYHSADQKVPVPASALTRLPCTPGDFDPAQWKVDDGECSF